VLGGQRRTIQNLNLPVAAAGSHSPSREAREPVLPQQEKRARQESQNKQHRQRLLPHKPIEPYGSVV